MKVSNVEAIGQMVVSGGAPSTRYEELYFEDGGLVWGSEGHYGYPNFGNRKNVGGAFLRYYRRKEIGTVDVGSIRGGSAYSNWVYTGSVAGSVESLGVHQQQDGSAWGATAFSKMKPDKPNMQALNAIYELREVPEMLRQRFHGSGLHEIGDYYLALQFGWKPLLTDIRNFVLTHINAQRKLEQLLRDEGKTVRHRISLVDSTTPLVFQDAVFNGLSAGLVTQFYKDGGRIRKTQNSSSKVWASARFRYWLPGGPRDVNWTRNMKARIFGFKPTPSVIYNAIPWSWLVDWFSNLGDVIDNLDTSIVDRLAADYFYVMRQEELINEQTATCTFFDAITGGPITVTATSRYVSGCKSRLVGDPFGFATPQNSLSGVQLSILGALGLSKLR
jgi:hypothetical protein